MSPEVETAVELLVLSCMQSSWAASHTLASCFYVNQTSFRFQAA